MKNTGLLTIVFVFSLVFSQCKTDPRDLMPNITGKSGELVLVMNDVIWKTNLGNWFKEELQKTQIGLPQDEPIFSLVRIPHSAFTKIFKTHRNLVFVEISSDIKKANIRVQKDKWAKNQVVIKISAPDVNTAMKLVNQDKGFINKQILQAENDRLVAGYRKISNSNVRHYLADKQNIKLVIPKGYTLDMDTTNFMWISRESRVSQAFFIYYYNYTDTNAFAKAELIKTRDKFLRQYVHGQRPNSYMLTEPNFDTSYEEFLLNGKYAVRLRGLWRVENDAMGGPFVSISTVDEARNRIVTVDGYVYAPKFDKRNYMRQVEAILNTLEFE